MHSPWRRMACVAGAALAVALVASAADRPTRSTIVFSSWPTGIMLMSGDGTDRRLLVATRQEAGADWAPDGTSIVFSDGRDFLSVMDYPDGPSHELAPPPGAGVPRRPRWWPDGPAIAFDAWAPEPRSDRDIFVTSLAGEPDSRLTRHRLVDEYPSWSPDGRQIAFFSNRDEAFWNPLSWPEDIFIVDADGRNPHNITRSKTREYNPDWSPDGSSIAFTRSPGNNDLGELWVLDVNTGRERQIEGVARVWSASWTPDGQSLLVTAIQDDSEATDIGIIDADGSNFRLLAATPESEYGPRMFDPDVWSVSPQGKLAATWAGMKGGADDGDP